MSARTRRAFDCLNFYSTASLAGALTTAVILTVSAVAPAVADPAVHPGHAIADRFAADADRARAAEAARKDAARQEAQRRRAAQAEKAAKEKAQKEWEAELLARAKAEAEDRRQLEIEASRLDAARAAREAQEAEAEHQRAERARLIEAQRQVEQARIAEDALKAEETKRAAEALRLAAERAAAEETRKAEEAKAQETRRIEAARLADEARRTEQAAWAAEEAKRAETIRKANEELRVAAERAAAEDAKRAEEAQRAVKRATEDETRRVGALEADAEVKRVAERLRRIREEHLARHTGSAERTVQPSSATVPVNRLGGPTVADAPNSKAATPQLVAGPPPEQVPLEAASFHTDGRVTVLLQMEPRFRRGRGHESMDPVLCLVDGCYVSNGPQAPATFLPGHRAMRFGNVIGRRAGACNHAHACVFRDVDIGALPAEVQPVDIRVLRHDRRQPESIDALSTCRGTAGRLACKDPIQGDGYTMWVIPEAVARRLPVELFGIAAAEEGSADSPRAAQLRPRGRW